MEYNNVSDSKKDEFHLSEIFSVDFFLWWK